MKNKTSSTKENQSRGSTKPLSRSARTEFTASPRLDIVELILRDHEPIKALLSTLKNADASRGEKESAFQEFVPLLMSHAKAEEKTLYTQMRELKELRVDSFEGDTEHAIADQLVHEINASPDDDEWNAKVKVLAESVEHHIEEEESEILNGVEALFDENIRVQLGEEYQALKWEFDSVMNPRPSHVRVGGELRFS